MKIFFVNNTAHWYHWGCYATCSTLLEGIRQFATVLNTWPAKRTYRDPWTGRPDKPEDFDNEDVFHHFAKHNPELIKHIQEHDVLVINGEGTIHGIKPMPLNLLYLAYIAKKFLKKPVFIVNHSVFPEDFVIPPGNKHIIQLYKKVYKTVDLVIVREKGSIDALKTLGIFAFQSFDCLPLYLKQKKMQPTFVKQDYILLGGSAALSGLASLQRQARREAYIEFVKSMIKEGHQFKMVIGAGADPAQDDAELAAILKVECPKGLEIITAHSADEFFSLIQNARLLVSGRFHHSMAAACLNTPFIALNSNTPKVDYLVADIGEETLVNFDDRDLTNILLERAKKKLHEKRDEKFTQEKAQTLVDRWSALALTGLQWIKVYAEKLTAKAVVPVAKEDKSRRATSAMRAKL